MATARMTSRIHRRTRGSVYQRPDNALAAGVPGSATSGHRRRSRSRHRGARGSRGEQASTVSGASGTGGAHNGGVSQPGSAAASVPRTAELQDSAARGIDEVRALFAGIVAGSERRPRAQPSGFGDMGEYSGALHGGGSRGGVEGETRVVWGGAAASVTPWQAHRPASPRPELDASVSRRHGSGAGDRDDKPLRVLDAKRLRRRGRDESWSPGGPASRMRGSGHGGGDGSAAPSYVRLFQTAGLVDGGDFASSTAVSGDSDNPNVDAHHRLRQTDGAPAPPPPPPPPPGQAPQSGATAASDSPVDSDTESGDDPGAAAASAAQHSKQGRGHGQAQGRGLASTEARLVAAEARLDTVSVLLAMVYSNSTPFHLHASSPAHACDR